MMRLPVAPKSRRGARSAVTASCPAPLGGWNARDPEAAMSNRDALWLENFWPETAEVTMRKGAAYQAQGLGGNVTSLMAYSSPTQQKLFASTTTSIFDVSTSSPVNVRTTLGGKFIHTLFTTVAGTFLIAVNGVDPLQLYNGTSWSSITAASSPAITGITTDNFDSVNVFKRRLWFVQKNSMSAWYLPVTSLGGAAAEFPLGQIFTDGGKLQAMVTWTVDGGSGADDYAVFISSEGQFAVYKGVDPATDFQLVGVYSLGAPVGKKCAFKYGGDVLIFTQIGLLPLSKALQSSIINRAQEISAKIDLEFSSAATAYGQLYGWQGVVFPGENIVITNIPQIEGSTSVQYVMNTITGSWALFTGWNAFCWETWGNNVYFGGNGFVAKALYGLSDFDQPITARVRTAFNYFGSSQQKHFTLFRPILKVSGNVTLSFGLDTDFEVLDYQSTTTSAQVTSNWDSAVWDTAVWGADYATTKDWRTIFNKSGFSAALRLRVTAKDVKVGWSSTDYVYNRGGVL